MSENLLACGKCILFGEHAVVYGKPGIGIPLKACKITGDFKESDEFRIFSNSIDVLRESKTKKVVNELLNAINEKFCRNYSIDDLKIEINLKSNIPLSSGFGSSAAFCVSLTRLFLQYFGINAKDSDVAEIANAGEKIYHGNPSGIDAAISSFRRPIIFKKGEKIEKIKIGGKNDEVSFFVIYTHRPNRSTKDLVESVAKIEESKRNKIMDEIEKITMDAAESIAIGNFQNLIKLIKENSECLEKLGIYSEENERIASEINSLYFAGCKVTGAGDGGGMILACFKNKVTDIIELLQNLGYSFLEKPKDRINEFVFWREDIF